MADSADKLGNDEPNLDHLHADLEAIRRYADDVASASGSLREHRKHLIDSRGYNKKALGFLYQIWKLPDEKYADFMRTFRDGLEQIEQSRRQRMTKDMFEGSETDHEAPEDEPDENGADPDFGDEEDDSDFTEGNTEHDPEDEDIEDLRAQARELGISAPHNIGAEKLRQRIADAL